MQIYVVTRQGWDYDDEYYYRPRYGGGDLVKAFVEQKDAKAFATQANIDECRDLLASDGDDIMCHLGEGESIKEKLTPDRLWGTSLPSEDCERLLAHFDVTSDYYSDEEEPIGISKNAQLKIPDEDWLMLSEALGFASHSVEKIELVSSDGK